MTLIYLFIFVLGAIVGSFLNVVILRHNTGRDLSGRSGCFSCGKKLHWYELFPVFSFLLQSGKCKGCKSRISYQYPLVEFSTGILFVLFAYLNDIIFFPSLLNILILVTDWAIWSTLVVIFVYDLKHMIIPDKFAVIFSIFALIRISILFYFKAVTFPFVIGHIVAGFVLALFFFSLWAISRGRWMGLGDSKLALGIGFYLGLAQGLSALAFAFWIGAFVALSRIGYERLMSTVGLRKGLKTITMKSEIPFAPFLILGTLLAFIFQNDLFHLAFFFS
jgi:prepilin signal peptidase PulO-like enzyme (type II secretory pathway)